MILCCGETVIDMLPRQTTEGGQAFMPVAGGAPLNSAIAMGRLGAKVGLISGLSRDLFGQVLVDAAKASHVDLSLTPRVDRPTTLAFVALKDGNASYSFYDENTALRMLELANIPEIPNSVDAMLFVGSWLMSEPIGSTLAKLHARETTTRVTIFDPNPRPALVPDRAAYLERAKPMMATSDVVKLGDEDIGWAYGTDDTAAVAGQILDGGARLVLVTEGAKGVTAYRASGSVHVPATPVTPVDTVGAGDTFSAGFLTHLQSAGLLSKNAVANLSDDALRSAMTLGIRAAAITVQRAGANPPWAHEL